MPQNCWPISNNCSSSPPPPSKINHSVYKLASFEEGLTLNKLTWVFSQVTSKSVRGTLLGIFQAVTHTMKYYRSCHFWQKPTKIQMKNTLDYFPSWISPWALPKKIEKNKKINSYLTLTSEWLAHIHPYTHGHL